MKKILRFFFFVLMLSFHTPLLWSQEMSSHEEPFHAHPSVGLFISHAHVFEGLDADGDRQALSLSSWGLDFNYHFHPQWAIGLHTDVIIEKFKVEAQDGETTEVNYPVAPALMAIFQPGTHWEFLAGLGLELTKEEQEVFNRIGLGYIAELSPGWEMAAALTYDLKWEAYDTWVLGLGVVHLFGHERHDGE